jgi:hypothetical protein
LLAISLFDLSSCFAHRQRAAAVKGHESEAGRRKQLPAPNGNNELQVMKTYL